MLLIMCVIIFIIYNFYIDYRDWSNVGGDFAEGMANRCSSTIFTNPDNFGSMYGSWIAAENSAKPVKAIYFNSDNESGISAIIQGEWLKMAKFDKDGNNVTNSGRYIKSAPHPLNTTNENHEELKQYYDKAGTLTHPKGGVSDNKYIFKKGSKFCNNIQEQTGENLTGKGADYRGKQNKTKGGYTCQNWNSDTPHKKNAANKKAYRDKKNGAGDHNYCRNPTGNHTNIWCYTTDKNKRWDDCEPLKPEDKVEDEDEEKDNASENNSIVLIDDNFKKPVRNNVIDIKNFKMGKDYELEFTIKPLGRKWGWSNILHNTFTGQNCCRVGDRYPAIWFWSNSTRLHISCGAKNSRNWNTTQNPNYNLPIKKESIVNIRLQNNIFSVTITDYNGNIVYSRNQSVNKTQPPKYIIEEKPKFYFSDPWSRSANVQVKNMRLINLDPKPVDETTELMKQLQSENANNMNAMNKQLLESLMKNKNNNMSMLEKLKLVQSLQQQNQLPRQVIQILQPPRQINEPMTAITGVAGLNMGDSMLQSVPSNIDLQPQSVPRISDFTLFNEDIMEKVLSNKNLIPNDVRIGEENKENYIRIGKNFMVEVSKVRNVALPNIEQDDYEKIGRIASKVYIKNKDNEPEASKKITQNSLIKIINDILNGADGQMTQPLNDNLRNPNQTTGMFSNNRNRHLSTKNTQKAQNSQNTNNNISGDSNTSGRLSKSDLTGSLCMWDGCDNSEKKPYDSVYSLF